MAGKKVNRLIVPNVYSVNGVEPVTSVNNILPVNGNVTIPIPTVPTNVSAFTNDAGYLTSATLTGYATQSWVQQQGYLTSVPSQYITDTELSTTLADYVTSSSLNTTLNSYATVTSLSTETSNRMDADDSLQSQINDKYDASNPAGFISGISSSDVITALGYTPYNNSNPNGYITSAALSDYVTNTDLSTTLADYAQTTDIPTVGNGTITINQGGVQKGTFTVNQSGNSTINLDAGGSSGTVDQTYDSTSANAQSGVAIAGELTKYIDKTTNQTISSSKTFSSSSKLDFQKGSIIHCNTGCGVHEITDFWLRGQSDWYLHPRSIVNDNDGISITKQGLTQKTDLTIDGNKIYDGDTGLIPDARISSNIARVSNIPTVPTNVSAFTNDSGYITGITSNDVTDALSYTPYNSSNPDGYQTSSDVNTIVTNAISTLLGNIYPVGSVYIGTQATCPLATLISGSTWELVAADRVLQGSSTNHAANTTIAAGLPNITGGALTLGRLASSAKTTTSGALTRVATTERGTGYYGSTKSYDSNVSINARNSNTIYGNSSTVQPPAYVVNVWRRTA